MSTKVMLTFDVDFQFLWIGTFRKTTLRELSRGEYGARVGIHRILDLLKDEDLKATFFIPGKVAEIYPELVLKIKNGGHEIGLHGYIHERWTDLDFNEEKQVIEKGKNSLESLIGSDITGFRSPALDLNLHSPGLLLDAGIKYDSSLSAQDYEPYYLRTGDKVNLDGNIQFGEESALMEFPMPWELDDFPYFSHGRHTGLAAPSEVKARWCEELDYAKGIPDSIVTYTMHPQVIGRGPRIEMVRDFIRTYKDKVEFCTMKEVYNFYSK